jgi:hypothetical protein
VIQTLPASCASSLIPTVHCGFAPRRLGKARKPLFRPLPPNN